MCVENTDGRLQDWRYHSHLLYLIRDSTSLLLLLLFEDSPLLSGEERVIATTWETTMRQPEYLV